jgi:Ni/Fe-hydrogenase subunit HybB-like protein
MSMQLILGIIAIGALAYIVIEKLLPLIAPVKV